MNNKLTTSNVLNVRQSRDITEIFSILKNYDLNEFYFHSYFWSKNYNPEKRFKILRDLTGFTYYQCQKFLMDYVESKTVRISDNGEVITFFTVDNKPICINFQNALTAYMDLIDFYKEFHSIQKLTKIQKFLESNQREDVPYGQLLGIISKSEESK